MPAKKMTRSERELRRAELSRITRFTGAVERLGVVVDEAFYRVSVELLPKKTERSPSKIEVELPENGIRIIEAPDQTLLENVMMKLRPIFSTSEKEECSFDKIVKILPKYFALELPMLDRLKARWAKTLDDQTVPLLAGGRISNVLPGYDAVTEAE